MASSRRTHRRRQQQSSRRHRFKLESLEKRYALDGDGLSISMNADYVAAGTTFPTDYGPGALANSGAPTNFFLPQDDLTPFSSESDSAPGMVITSLNLQGGKLWYSTNAGSTWSEISSASEVSGTVLLDDGNTRLHYEPTAGFSGQVTDVFSFKSYDFAASVASGTSQFDATVGSSLQSVGSYVIDHTLYPDTFGDGGKISLFSDGTRAAAIHDDGLEILDISNPSSIQRIGITPPPVSEEVGILFNDVHIAGFESSVFINPTIPTTSGAFVVSLADQSSPQLVPYSNNPAPFAYTLTSNLDGSLVVKGSTGGGGDPTIVGDEEPNLYFFDTTDRASPSLLSTFRLTLPSDVLGSDLEAHSLTMSPHGNTLYVSCLSDSFPKTDVPLFFVVDISDVTQPRVIAEVQNTNLSASLSVHCLSPDGNTLFVAGDNSSDPNGKRFLSAYNVSNPSSPTQMWRHEVTDGNNANRHYANEIIHDPATGKIYVAYDTGVRAYEIDGSGVVSETLISPAGMTNSVAVSADGQTIYVMGQELLSVYAAGQSPLVQSTSVTVTVSTADTGNDSGIPASFRHREPYSNSSLQTHSIDSDMMIPVSNLIGASDHGIAITDAQMRHGRLLFTTDSGESWSNVGPVSSKHALLIAANPSNQLFYYADSFDPKALPLAETFSFHAWDGTYFTYTEPRYVNTTFDYVVGDFSVSFPTNEPYFSKDGNFFIEATAEATAGPSLYINVYDSTNLFSPELLGSVYVPNGAYFSNNSALLRTRIAGDYAFIHNYANTGKYHLSVIDLSVPAMPRVISQTEIGTGAASGDMFFKEGENVGYLYRNDGSAPYVSLQTIDFTNPSNVVLGENEISWIKRDATVNATYQTLVVSVDKRLVFTISQQDGMTANECIRVYSLDTQKEVFFQQEYGEEYKRLWLNKNESQLFVTEPYTGEIRIYDIAENGELSATGQLYVSDDAALSEIELEFDDQYLSIFLRTQDNHLKNLIYDVSGSGMPQFLGVASDSETSGEYFTPFLVPERGTIFQHDVANMEDFIQQFPIETSPGHPSAIADAATAVPVTYADTEASIFGADTGVINTGRTARGELLWKDSDNFKHPYGDSGRYLSSNIMGSPNYHNVFTSAIVIANGQAGHATVSTSFSTTESIEGLVTAHVFSTSWFYDAGSNFDGSDSFTIRFYDEIGGYTDKVITVTGEPSQSIGLLANMAIHQNQSGSLASYSLPAVGVQGESLNGGIARITATSSNQALIADPTTIYASQDVPTSISFTPAAGLSGSATISMQIEDGGADNNLATAHDNGHATHQIEVNVLEVISNQGSAILAKDSSDSLYVNTQPVIYNQQQVPQAFFGSSVVSADTSDSENTLMLKPLGADAEEPPTHRLLTDETWRINGIFNSLQNASSPVLDLSGREVSGALNIVAVAGAYEIHGVSNPTLIVRRGQTYTFNLNTAGHPFYLQTTGGGYQSANVYSNGFTGNSQTTGEHQWVVPQDAPDEIFYQCEFHPVMFGKIIVVD